MFYIPSVVGLFSSSSGKSFVQVTIPSARVVESSSSDVSSPSTGFLALSVVAAIAEELSDGTVLELEEMVDVVVGVSVVVVVVVDSGVVGLIVVVVVVVIVEVLVVTGVEEVVGAAVDCEVVVVEVVASTLTLVILTGFWVVVLCSPPPLLSELPMTASLLGLVWTASFSSSIVINGAFVATCNSSSSSPSSTVIRSSQPVCETGSIFPVGVGLGRGARVLST